LLEFEGMFSSASGGFNVVVGVFLVMTAIRNAKGVRDD
jgi:hypothetical protein